jgi:TolB-like protein/Flp pilus assembly protein TadD
MNGPASDVFISYKAEDRKRLTPLVKALEDEGFDVWWDQHIGGGTNWREEIETHLDAAKVVIVVWSKKTVGPEGRFVRDEAGQAQEAGHYLPITVDNVRPPLGFREVQALDLSSWKGNRADPRFQVLADTIRHRLAGKDIGRKALVVGNATPVSRRGLMMGGAGAVAIAGVGGWALFKPDAAAASNRIAVMTFSNLSSDPEQAYFSEGIAEELRGALSRVGMQVIGRASSDAVRDLDTQAAASKLGVANILTGSVRRSPDTIRVGAQLVNGADGLEKWGQSYDRAPGDTIKIQTDIAAQVAGALSIALGAAKKAALTIGGTTSAKAQDLYLQARVLGRSADSAEALQKTIALYDAALADDPDYGDANVGKGKSLLSYASQYATTPTESAAVTNRAEQSARRAASLMPASGRPTALLADISSSRLDFAGAMRGFEQALRTDPNDPAILVPALNNSQWLGDGEEALTLADRAVALDPLNPTSHSQRGNCLYALRRYSESIEAQNKALVLAPQRNVPRHYLAQNLMLLKRPAEAQAVLAKVPPEDPFRQTNEAILAARGGKRAEAEAQIVKIRAVYADQASYQYGQIYAQLGDAHRAFTALDKAVEARDPGLLMLKRDPFLDPIRRDPRYAALLTRLKFP